MEKSSQASSYTSSATTKPSTAAATHTTSSSSSSIDRSANTSNGSSVTTAQNAIIGQLNKSSYKISKPTTSKHLGGGTKGDGGNPSHQKSQPPPLPPPEAPPAAAPPPVYNINKNDFRDVVQKLTGFPAHHARQPSPSSAPFPPPPRPVLPPNAACGGGTPSRLHKIRPPPLAQLTARPPPPLAPAAARNPLTQADGDTWVRSSPLSPLPPFPAVSAAAESPITAYMKCLRSGSVPHQQVQIPSPRGSGSSGCSLFPLAPSSSLGFGCVPSPRSAYQTMISPGLVFPPSPTPSPRWGDQ